MPVTNPYLDIPAFDDFTKVLDPSVYHALPDDWWVGTSDIVGSTKAVEAGRYKEVNMVGASIIAATTNAIGHSDFPFIFGGDGAAIVCPPDKVPDVRNALAATAIWAKEELGFDLRIALIRINDIRKGGHDVRVARFLASKKLAYAVFSGRGISWAEDQMKQGHNLIAPAPSGTQPDLTGLSCRWSPISAEDGCKILSLIMLPRDDRHRFDLCATALFGILEQDRRDSNPVPETGPDFRLGWESLRLEALATQGTEGSKLRAWCKALFISCVALFLFKTGRKLGDFDPLHYRHQTRLNTDFRRFGDGIWLTVNCNAEQTEQIETLLSNAENNGDIWFGIKQQDEALMTCIVPDIASDSHLHFLDGADGGYTAAASVCKAKMKKTATQPLHAEPAST
ncbi:DUF3095 domain-containing protein [Thalassospira australica]|uniref:DUF3095 domain-containing protein n=1 Tax=Thalassospira australica TaxID=1528106 RepID=UPI00384E720E